METDDKKFLVESIAAGLQARLTTSSVPPRMMDLLLQIEAEEMKLAARSRNE